MSDGEKVTLPTGDIVYKAILARSNQINRISDDTICTKSWNAAIDAAVRSVALTGFQYEKIRSLMRP